MGLMTGSNLRLFAPASDELDNPHGSPGKGKTDDGHRRRFVCLLLDQVSHIGGECRFDQVLGKNLLADYDGKTQKGAAQDGDPDVGQNDAE